MYGNVWSMVIYFFCDVNYCFLIYFRLFHVCLSLLVTVGCQKAEIRVSQLRMFY